MANDESLLERFVTKPLKQFFSRILLLCVAGLAHESHAADDPMIIEAIRERIAQGMPAEGLLFFNRDERETAFAHMDALFPTRAISASPSPKRLVSAPRNLAALTYEFNGNNRTVGDFLAERRTRGLLVVQGDQILLEHYAKNHGPDARWVSFSVTKSVTAMLIGAAIRDGYIESVNDPVSRYVPRFQGTPYGDVTVENVLQMASGIAWNEDYTDPESDVAKAGGANGIRLLNYLKELSRAAPAGEQFNYNTAETNLAGEILRAAIGNNATTYLEKTIWHPFGMADAAHWMLGEPYGGELGGCCISATLRDYARLGLFAMSQLNESDDHPISAQYMRDSVAPSKGFDGYGYFWWLQGEGRFSALGIFGQQIFVNPALEMVVAVHGNDDVAEALDYEAEVLSVIRAIEASL